MFTKFRYLQIFIIDVTDDVASGWAWLEPKNISTSSVF